MGIFGGGDGSREDYLALEARVASLEAAVAKLSAILAGGAPPSAAPGEVPYAGASSAVGAPWDAEARALKAQGKAIAAIKLVREATHWGLKEAKDYVDRL
ncbi:MAG: ribosomal protein L7/L12 [Nocardioidaceae bacterium]|nr:ribosomal protein L7/L12 [Nocardioidaceae bacterium]